jgi:tetratricopeptide (TPR) repeat protein
LGNVLLEEEIITEASEKLKRALEIQWKKLGEKHNNTANTYFLIGRVFQEQGNQEKAEELCRSAAAKHF